MSSKLNVSKKRDDYRQPYVRRNAHQFTEGKEFCSQTFICKGKPFIPLWCPHCHFKCLRFREYKSHLLSDKHNRAMVKRIQFIEKRVDLLREKQRLNQGGKANRASSSAVVKYCVVCDVELYEEESKHISSKLHVDLEELLKPKCSTCSYQSKDSVDYENHISSLEHIKKEEGWSCEVEESPQDLKQELVLQPSSLQEASGNRKNTGNPFSENSLCDPENRMNIGVSENFANTGNKGGPSDVRCQSMGDISAISKVEALYCKCCNQYFSSDGGHKVASIKHCRTAEHQEMWLKYIEDEEGRK